MRMSWLRALLAGALVAASLSAYPALAFEQEDLVCETTTATGTGRTTINLSGTACANYLTFAAGGVASGQTVTYTIQASDGSLETGTATFTDAAPDTLTSFSVLASSDGAATALDLPAGTHNVFLQWNSASYEGNNAAWAIDSLDVNDITGLDTIDTTTESTLEGAIDLPDLQGTLGVGKGGTGQTTEAEALGEMTQALTADGTPDRDADYVMTYDADADTGKKVLLEDVNDYTLVRQIITATGTYTPTTGAYSFFVRCQASGGGGGGADDAGGNPDAAAGGGGGGGQYVEMSYDATEMGASASVTIGAGGAAGSTLGTAGGDGGDGSFNPIGTGTTITFESGHGGEGDDCNGGCTDYATESSGGVGGDDAASGDFEVDGEEGFHNYRSDLNGKDTTCSGRGGNSVLGRGGANLSCYVADGANLDYTGEAGDLYGGGGAGGNDDDSSGSAGGAGGAGICIVDELVRG